VENAKKIMKRIWGKKGVFTCTIASTLTSTIPGISEAGDTPELTLFTGPADAELLMAGKVLCMKDIPMNPGNIPTPATLTKAALELSKMPFLIINGGSKVTPKIPCIEVGGVTGEKVTTGHAMTKENVERAFEYGKILGNQLADTFDYVVISESCAGGTTTALAVLLAMGVIRENLVSSSSPKNPKQFKWDTVMEGFKAAGVSIGDLKDDPLKAMELFGDPMMPVNTGIAIGAMKKVPVIFGGGTQMAPVMAAVLKLDPSLIGNMVQGTTRWLLADPNSNMVKIAESISPEIPIVSINMDYSDTPYEGLQAYEWGYIKEGVGCGGSCVAAVASSSGAIGCREILERVESIYEKLVKH
jgi:uncharacterized protein (TIGR00303 family)